MGLRDMSFSSLLEGILMGAKSRKSRRIKALVGVVALTAGFAGVVMQPSVAVAELCGGGKESGCVGAGMVGTGGDHDTSAFSPPRS
jgi:hypothetical protein